MFTPSQARPCRFHTCANPLNAIGLSLDEIAERPEEERRELASTARRQIRRIDQAIRFIEHLKSFMRQGIDERVEFKTILAELKEIAEDRQHT